MPTDAEIEEFFLSTVNESAKLTGERQSQTNVPDVRNLPSSQAQILNPLQAARAADLEAVRREGVPLDTETGAPAGTRFRLAFTDDTPSAIKTLQSEYGAQNIAVSPQGQLVIRNLMDEKTGKVQDLVVDEERMSAKDILDLFGAIPGVAGAVLAMRGGARIPKVGQATGKTGFLRDLVLGSAGGQAGSEIAERIIADTDRTLGESLRYRAKGAGTDAAFNLLTAGTAKFIPAGIARVAGPLSGQQGLVQTEAVKAIGRIENATGIRVPLSIGEETGHPLVMKAEALLEKVPGGTSTIRQQKAIQEDRLRQVQQYMLGQGPLPSEASVGFRAVERLKAFTGAGEQMTADAKRNVAETASKEILDAFGTMTLPERQLYKSPVGKAIRLKAESEMERFKAANNELYGEVYATPGAGGPIIPTVPLSTAAKNIKANLPKKTEVVEEVSDFVDAQGRPIVKTTENKEVLREFVPAQLRRFVDELESGLDPKMPLNEVVQMRQIVNDGIAQSDLFPGISNRFLKQVSHALTDALDEGVKNAPDPTLAAKFKKANEFYKTNRPRFERRGIAELYRAPDVPGAVGDAEIVKRVIAGEGNVDRYNDIREFLGPDSSEFKMLKRSVLDSLYEDSEILGQSGIIDAQTFLNRVKDIDPEIRRDLFGKSGDAALRTAQVLGSVQGKIDVNDIDKILSGKTKQSFDWFVRNQKSLDRTYANDVIKKFTKGEVGTEAIQPEEFVGRFLDVAKSPRDIEQVMALMQDRPDLTTAIRRKTLERFFSDAARRPSPIDLTKQVIGDPTRPVGGQSLLKALGDENNQEKLRIVLGADTMSLLKDLVRVEAAQEVKEETAKTVGGLVGGGIVSRLMRFDFKDAMAIAKYKLAAATLADPRFRAFLTQQVQAPDTQSLARAIIASGPFIQAMADEFKTESGLAAFMSHLNESLEGAVGNQPNQPQSGNPDAALQQYFQQ